MQLPSPAGPHRPTGDAKYFGGMDMNGKKKFLIAALLFVVALSFFLGPWSYTACALGKAVAPGLVGLLVFLRFLAGITGMHFLL